MISTFQFRAARSGLGITLAELSRITNIGYATLWKLEKGKVFNQPKLRKETLKKIEIFYSNCGIKFFNNNTVSIEFKTQLQK